MARGHRRSAHDSRLAPTLMSFCVCAAYGCEYWFDHQIEKQDLSTVQFARGFAPAFVYDLGTTKCSQVLPGMRWVSIRSVTPQM